MLVPWICVVRGNVGCCPDGGLRVSSSGEYRYLCYRRGEGIS